jgi:hypothetical protein
MAGILATAVSSHKQVSIEQRDLPIDEIFGWRKSITKQLRRLLTRKRYF